MYSSYVVPLLITCLIGCVSCTGTGDITTKDNGTFNGKALYDMGIRFNKPILRLIAKALMATECKYHPCSKWTQWSSCKLFIGQYGMQTRTRQCGGAIGSGCKLESVQREERQSGVCQDFCPSAYELTVEGFCLKFYKSTTKSKIQAETDCENDGGHLMNINSEKKWEAFSNLMARSKYTSYVHTDGQRKDNSSPWTFSYEDYIRGYTKWASGQPNNGSNELCICAYKSTSGEGLFDVPCSSKRYYVCEIVPA